MIADRIPPLAVWRSWISGCRCGLPQPAAGGPGDCCVAPGHVSCDALVSIAVASSLAATPGPVDAQTTWGRHSPPAAGCILQRRERCGICQGGNRRHPPASRGCCVVGVKVVPCGCRGVLLALGVSCWQVWLAQERCCNHCCRMFGCMSIEFILHIGTIWHFAVCLGSGCRSCSPRRSCG